MIAINGEAGASPDGDAVRLGLGAYRRDPAGSRPATDSLAKQTGSMSIACLALSLSLVSTNATGADTNLVFSDRLETFGGHWRGGHSDLHAADLDGDGDLDVLSASWDYSGSFIWWRRNDGQGEFSGWIVVSRDADGARDVQAADLDGDGDLDVLSASQNYSGSFIRWHRNDGEGEFSEQIVVSTDADGAVAVHAADLDGDGDLDVLSASERDDKIAWYRNDGQGEFSGQLVVSTDADGARDVHAADLDGDGDLDVLSASEQDDKIAWYRNDGQGEFSGQLVVSTDADGARDVHAADLDEDGDLDVLSASERDGKIAWYRNDGQGEFSEQITVSREAEGVEAMQAADLDGDGDVDVLSASAGKIAWYRNDGQGEFSGQLVVSTDAGVPQAMQAADLDGDGDLDLLSASGWIGWYRNDGPSRFTAQLLVSTDADEARDVHAADLDGDGDVDVLSASERDDKIAWYRNEDGAGAFSEPNVVSTDADGAQAVHAADLDGDGDLDVLSASWNDDKIAWYRNDGAGAFSEPNVVSTDADGAVAVHAADLDGDGDFDVLSASYFDDKIAWYRNDGKGVFSEPIILSTADEAWDVHAGDLDGDGDLDVLSASRGGDSLTPGRIAWYRNEDGQGAFSEPIIVSRVLWGWIFPRGSEAEGVRAVQMADLDGDGNLDVLFASSGSRGKIAWYRNEDGQGAFPDMIVVSDADEAWDVRAADLDGDGDLDLLSALASTKIAWYRNDGQGEFSEPIAISRNAEGIQAVHTADLDGDGDLDALSASYLDDKIAWYSNFRDRVFEGSSRSYRFVGEHRDDRAGWSFGTVRVGARDFVAVGAPFHDPGGPGTGFLPSATVAGAAYLIAVNDLAAADQADGRWDGTIHLGNVAAQPSSWKLVGAASGDRAGWSVAPYDARAGGAAEGVAVGAPGRAAAAGRGEGAVYLVAADALAPADAADGETDGVVDLGNVATLDDSWVILAESGATLGGTVVSAGDVGGPASHPGGADPRDNILIHAWKERVSVRVDVDGNPVPLDPLGFAYVVSVADLPAADAADGDTDGTVLARHLWSGADSWNLLGPELGGAGGAGLASAGDTDGDGFADLLIGTPDKNRASLAAAKNLPAARQASARGDGRIQVDKLWPQSSSWRLFGERLDDRAGAAVASAGDIDGDGMDDLLVGAPEHPVDGRVAGAAYLIAAKSLKAADGNDDGKINLARVRSQPDSWKFVGEGFGNRIGVGLASAGDLNGDGLADILIGADDRETHLIATSDLPDADTVDGDEDRVIYLGNVAGLADSWTIRGRGRSAGAVVGPTTMGDMDGDGRPELLIGGARDEDAAGYLVASRDWSLADRADGREDGIVGLHSIFPRAPERASPGTDDTTASDWPQATAPGRGRFHAGGPVATANARPSQAGGGAAPDGSRGSEPGVIVGAVRGNTVGLNSAAEFDLRLLSPPTREVAIPVASSDATEGITEVDEVVFGPDDWDVPRTVVVRGRNPARADGGRDYEILLGPVRSRDPAYDGLEMPGVAMRGIVLEIEPPARLTPLVAGNDAAIAPRVVYTGDRRLSFALVEAPAGMSIDFGGGEIAWTPDASDEGGEFDVAVAVNDGARFARASFRVSVVRLTPVATDISGDALTVTDAGTDLRGMTVALDPDGIASANATTDLADLDIALMPDGSLHPVPDEVTRLSDAFVVRRPHAAGVRIEMPVPDLPDGRSVRDLKLYTLATAAAAGERFWTPVFGRVEYAGAADAPLLGVELDGLHGVFFFGAEGRADRSPTSAGAPFAARAAVGLSAASAGIECAPDHQGPRDGPGDEHRLRTCAHANAPALQVNVVDFGASASATRWDGVAVEEMVGWLVEAATELDALGLDRADEFNVLILERGDASDHVPATWIEGGRTLRIGASGTAAAARAATARALFRHAWLRSAEAGDGLPLDRRADAWLIEGFAHWFADRVHDEVGGARAINTPRLLEEGLAAARGERLMPRGTLAFVKLLESRCAGFDRGLRDLVASGDGGRDAGLGRLAAWLDATDCDFGDHFGAGRRSSLEAALGYYGYATLFENDMNLLDVDGNEPLVDPARWFRPPSRGFDRDRGWMADAVNWSNLPAEAAPGLNGRDHIPPAGAYSFEVEVGGGVGFAGKVAAVEIESDGELLVSVTSRDPRFQGRNMIGAHAHDWFSTATRRSYALAADGAASRLFVTLVNPSLAETVGARVHFRVADGTDADVVITSHAAGDEVHTRVVSVAGIVPAAARDAVSKVVVTANGVPTDAAMDADGAFAADVVVSLGDNMIAARAFGASAPVANEAVVTVRGVPSDSGGANALVPSRLVAALRSHADATDLDIYSTDAAGRTVWFLDTSQGPGRLDHDAADGRGPDIVSYAAGQSDSGGRDAVDIDVHYRAGAGPTTYALDLMLNEHAPVDRRRLRFESVVPLAVADPRQSGPHGSGPSRLDGLIGVSCDIGGTCSLSGFDADKLVPDESRPRVRRSPRQPPVGAPSSVLGEVVPVDGADAVAVESLYERCARELEAHVEKSGDADWYCNPDGTKNWR